jgi:hypothetical protein
MRTTGKQHNDARATNTAASPWLVLAKVGAAIVAVGGVAFHYTGLVGHIAYLRAWGVDAGLFPKPIDWLMINGAAAFVDRTVVMLALANTITWPLVATALLCFVVLTIAFRVFIASGSPNRPDAEPVASNASPWTASLGFGVASTLSIFGTVPIAILLFAALILFPWVMGEAYGAAAAKRELAIFDRGCQTAPSGYRCIDVRKVDQLLLRGFLIESSPTHLAIYDPQTRRTRTIPRDGTDLITDPLPSAGSASLSGK